MFWIIVIIIIFIIGYAVNENVDKKRNQHYNMAKKVYNEVNYINKTNNPKTLNNYVQLVKASIPELRNLEQSGAIKKDSFITNQLYDLSEKVNLKISFLAEEEYISILDKKDSHSSIITAITALSKSQQQLIDLRNILQNDANNFQTSYDSIEIKINHLKKEVIIGKLKQILDKAEKEKFKGNEKKARDYFLDALHFLKSNGYWNPEWNRDYWDKTYQSDSNDHRDKAYQSDSSVFDKLVFEIQQDKTNINTVSSDQVINLTPETIEPPTIKEEHIEKLINDKKAPSEMDLLITSILSWARKEKANQYLFLELALFLIYQIDRNKLAKLSYNERMKRRNDFVIGVSNLKQISKIKTGKTSINIILTTRSKVYNDLLTRSQSKKTFFQYSQKYINLLVGMESDTREIFKDDINLIPETYVANAKSFNFIEDLEGLSNKILNNDFPVFNTILD